MLLFTAREEYFGTPKEMNDPYRDMPAGLIGTVDYVDDAGTIHVKWANGSTLGVVYGEDHLRRIENQ